MDISAVDSYQDIGGISQPVIGQRKIEHEIRLKDGEANLLGGILEDQDVQTSTGYPGLSNVPILKYLFSSKKTDKTQNELVFILTPHIVRGQELNALNVRPIDIGTGSTIELRPVSMAPDNTATAPPPTSPRDVQTLKPEAPAVAPGPTPSGALFSFSPSEVRTTVGQTFMMDVAVSNVQNLFSVPVQIQYDPTKLQVVNVSNGGFLGQGGQAVAVAQRDDPSQGLMQLTAIRPPNSGGVSGRGSVFSLTFLAKDSGQASVSIVRAGLRDANNQSIAASGSQAVVNIQAARGARGNSGAPGSNGAPGSSGTPQP